MNRGWQCGLAAAALLVPSISAAQDADTKEILAYVLTDAGLAKYTAATKKLAALESANPGACDEDSEASSINEMTAKLNAAPGAKAAIQSSGLSTREYVVLSWSIMQNALAAWAMSAGGTLPAGASKANVDFYRKHEAEIHQMEGLKSSGCDDDQSDEKTDDG